MLTVASIIAVGLVVLAFRSYLYDKIDLVEFIHRKISELDANPASAYSHEKALLLKRELKQMTKMAE